MPAPHVCIPRVLPRESLRPQRIVGAGDGRMRALLEFRKLWINGSTLRVQWLGGSTNQRANARMQALRWTEYANLQFVFNAGPEAEIRVAFDPNDGAWSYLGTDCRGIPAGHPTMNLGFEDGGTATHEFGHAIGLGHEHQSPFGGLRWNEAAVIADLGGPPNFWSPEEVRAQVLEKYTVDQIRGTAFDPDSIMLYAFPASWTLDGVSTHENRVLSEQDRAFIASAAAYPKPATPVEPAPPEMRWVEVAIGAVVRARIGTAGEEDLFSFNAGASGVYEIRTGGSQDLVMKLYGPTELTRLIAEDDDSGYSYNALIRRSLRAGRYYAQVRHYSARGLGDYTLTVQRVS